MAINKTRLTAIGKYLGLVGARLNSRSTKILMAQGLGPTHQPSNAQLFALIKDLDAGQRNLQMLMQEIVRAHEDEAAGK